MRRRLHEEVSCYWELIDRLHELEAADRFAEAQAGRVRSLRRWDEVQILTAAVNWLADHASDFDYNWQVSEVSAYRGIFKREYQWPKTVARMSRAARRLRGRGLLLAESSGRGDRLWYRLPPDLTSA